MLRVVDSKWMEHLDHMDMLRDGINLRAYGQRNPLVEYKIEALDMFEEMESAIMDQIASLMYHVSIVTPQQQEAEAAGEPVEASVTQKQKMEETIKAQRSQLSDHEVSTATAKKAAAAEKVGRNDPCPCGSGKKYKNCCGRR